MSEPVNNSVYKSGSLFFRSRIKNFFLMNEVLLSISLASCGLIVKILITLEPHGIIESNFAHLFILTLFSHWVAKR